MVQRFNLIRAKRNIPPGTSTHRANPILNRLDLMSNLIWRDFSLRYKQSLLGILWSLILPLAQLLVMVFLFQSVVPLNIEAYPAFVFCALLPWTWFSSTLSSACNLLVANRDLVRHPNFAPASLVVINTLSNLITFLTALPIMIAVLVVYQLRLTPALLFFPLLLLIQGTLLIGLSMIIASVNVFYRDVQHIVVVSLSLLFYLAPVFYRPQSVVAQYHIIYALNPIAILVEAYRAIFFYGISPSWPSLLFASVSSLVICGLGYALYRRQRNDIIDYI